MKSKVQLIRDIRKEVEELHPLLEQLLPQLPNVTRCENTHGNTEMGADFVVVQADEISGAEQYIGVIAKAQTIKQNHDEVERQISECRVPRKIAGGKKQIVINEIWIVTSQRITNGAKEKIHLNHASTSLKLIDCEQLAKLTERFLPIYFEAAPLQVSQYLKNTSERIAALESASSLAPDFAREFYVDQDLEEIRSRDYRSQRTGRRKKRDRVLTPTQVLEQGSLIWIEGGMGAGKSKLLRALAMKYASPQIFSECLTVPIFVQCRDVLSQGAHTLEGILAVALGDAARDLPKQTKFLVLVDGIDETQEASADLRGLLRELSAEVRARADVQLVMASRTMPDLDPILESEAYRQFRLKPLSTRRVLEFISQLCHTADLESRLVEDLKKSFLFHELPQSPIAAILLAKLLTESRTELPANLTELYAKFTELALGRWDQQKGLQSQIEYTAAENIVIELALFMLDHDTPAIAADELERQFFRKYLERRNINVDPRQLFDKVLRRSELLSYDPNLGTVAFRHRSFAEFFYAKGRIRDHESPLSEKAFDRYWQESCFFYVGLLRDCPRVIRQLVQLVPATHAARMQKLLAMAKFLLAGYLTPYEEIENALAETYTEAAILYREILREKPDTPLTTLSTVHLLWLFQAIMRHSYAYRYFEDALNVAGLKIDDAEHAPEVKATALFFINVTLVTLGTTNNLDFLLKKYFEELPFDIMIATRLETRALTDGAAKSSSKHSTLMRKQDKRLTKLLKGNESLKAALGSLYDVPIRDLKPQRSS